MNKHEAEPSRDEDWDGSEMFDDDAALRVGMKVIEMADRLNDVAAAMPGAQATWFFEIEGRRYNVTLTVADRA